MIIYCCECEKDVDARLTNGSEIYPHRKDLYSLPFWICNACSNYVGTHHKTKDKTRPLGVIPNKQIRLVRQEIHKLIDPIWKNGKMDRKEIYALVSNHIGYNFHTANIRSVKEGRLILSYIVQQQFSKIVKSPNCKRCK